MSKVRTNGFDKDPERASRAGKKSSNALPADLKEARLQNARRFESLIYKYMRSPVNELKAVMKDPKTEAQDLVVIRILVLAIEKGDHQRLGFLLDRTIGPMPKILNLNVENDPLEGKSVDELLLMKQELSESNRKTLEYLSKERAVSESAVIDITPTAGIEIRESD